MSDEEQPQVPLFMSMELATRIGCMPLELYNGGTCARLPKAYKHLGPENCLIVAAMDACDEPTWMFWPLVKGVHDR